MLCVKIVEKGKIYIFPTLKGDLYSDSIKSNFGQLISTILGKVHVEIEKYLPGRHHLAVTLTVVYIENFE